MTMIESVLPEQIHPQGRRQPGRPRADPQLGGDHR